MTRDRDPASRTRGDRPGRDGTRAERLSSRVRELERQLRRERSRADGLARGVAALSEQVAALRRQGPGVR